MATQQEGPTSMLRDLRLAGDTPASVNQRRLDVGCTLGLMEVKGRQVRAKTRGKHCSNSGMEWSMPSQQNEKDSTGQTAGAVAGRH